LSDLMVVDVVEVEVRWRAIVVQCREVCL
jgi:hypothetical protein